MTASRARIRASRATRATRACTCTHEGREDFPNPKRTEAMTDFTAEHDEHETANPELEAARERITKLAIGLQLKFGPVATACLLSGAAVACLRASLGDETAARYFREVGDDILAERETLQ